MHAGNRDAGNDDHTGVSPGVILLPPAGLNLFIAAFRFNRPITELYRAVVPFILLMIVALMMVTYIPKLTVVPGGPEAAPTAAAPADAPAAVPATP